MPKYSVIIPVYNVETYLSACLDSVLAQKNEEDYEIILVDDGSPDGSGAICDDYAARFGNIRVLHTANHGVSRARNLATAAAVGEYILYLDADDLWEPELLQELDQLSEKNPDVMVFGDLRLTEQGAKVPDAQDKVIPAGESGMAFLQELFRVDAVPRAYSCCYAVRRTLLQENGISFREDMKVSEDFDLVMRVLAAAKSVVGTPKQMYCYRVRENSATAKLTEKKLMDNLTTKAYYFRRYPVAAMANIYADNALLVTRLKKKDAARALEYLKENRDIWNVVSQTPLKLGRVLVVCFGDYGGVAVYHMIRRVVHILLGK